MTVIFLILRWSLMAIAGMALAGFLLVAGLALYALPSLPPVDELASIQYHVPLRVYSHEGDLLAEFGEKRRIPLDINAIPLQLKQAVIAAEDDRYYEHPGVDYQGILRAAFKVAQSGEAVQGGSTITMQVARNFFLSSERTFWRKLREILLSFQIEKHYSKDEILALYLNQNYMGKRAYGVGAAAQTYYGKDINELSLPQLAMMAGLYKAPSAYNPVVNPERAKQRRNYVLRRMSELGYISDEAAREAQAAPITARTHAPQTDVEAGYIAEMVRSYLFDQYGDDVYSMGLHVTTTISKELQSAANLALRNTLLDYDARHGWRGVEKHLDMAGRSQQELDQALDNFPTYGGLRAGLVMNASPDRAAVYLGDGEVADLDRQSFAWVRPYVDEDTRGDRPAGLDAILQAGDVVRVQRNENGWRLAQLPDVGGALVSISPEDGSILALTGGFDYFYSRFNRATQAVRQPGSNFKPFVYSAALANGFTPASVFNDAPVVQETEVLGEATLWRPENYTGRFYGPTRMRTALAQSRNLVSIRLLREVGVKATLKHLEHFKLTDRPMPADLSLSLGTGGLTPLELVAGYATFSNQGYRVEPYFIERISDNTGKVLYQHVPMVACAAPCSGLITPELLQMDPAALSSGKRFGRPAERVLPEENAYQMVSMMKDVITMGTGSKAKALGRKDLAGKTGTTNDQIDAWFSGFNRHVATTVWVGFDEHRPLGKKETGGMLALPAWMDFMKVALRGQPQDDWRKPDGMVTIKIDAETGLKAGPSTRKFAFEVFTPDTVPKEAVATLTPIEGVDVPEQIF